MNLWNLARKPQYLNLICSKTKHYSVKIVVVRTHESSCEGGYSLSFFSTYCGFSPDLEYRNRIYVAIVLSVLILKSYLNFFRIMWTPVIISTNEEADEFLEPQIRVITM